MAAGRVQTDYEFEDFSTPIVPVSMTIEELVNGARWLANKVYDPNSFLQRLERVLAENGEQDRDGEKRQRNGDQRRGDRDQGRTFGASLKHQLHESALVAVPHRHRW